MTNFYANASALVKSPSFDKGNVYTMAWQSGMTGIGYDPTKVGRKITSWKDLTDPAFKGKIGMFGDNTDLPNSALLAIGVAPETSKEADWHNAAAWLKKQQPLVRKYYQQDYIDPLSKGDIWISMAWSGDIFQANASGAALEFVLPEEGAPIWTDNMCIPKHAAHPLDAMTWMDFVYTPDVAAMLAEGVNYVTPVPGAQAVIGQDAAAATGDNQTSLDQLAKSPLVFPAQADYSKLHRYRVLTAAEEKTWNSIFEPIYQS
jgi:spermidine/putrescine transport system substrate-binding protein